EENELMELDQDIQSGDDESDEEIEKIVFDIQNFQNIQEERNDDESDHEWESDGEELEENIGIPLAQLFGMWEVCVSVEDDSVYNIYEYGVCSSHLNFDISGLHGSVSRNKNISDMPLLKTPTKNLDSIPKMTPNLLLIKTAMKLNNLDSNPQTEQQDLKIEDYKKLGEKLDISIWNSRKAFEQNCDILENPTCLDEYYD
ncbi:9496_t:CDS:2, partial [Entrophospora sp. SA101]